MEVSLPLHEELVALIDADAPPEVLADRLRDAGMDRYANYVERQWKNVASGIEIRVRSLRPYGIASSPGFEWDDYCDSLRASREV